MFTNSLKDVWHVSCWRTEDSDMFCCVGETDFRSINVNWFYSLVIIYVIIFRSGGVDKEFGFRRGQLDIVVSTVGKCEGE